MISFIKGIIYEVGSDYLVVENNQIGYLINMGNTQDYKINDEVTVFVYQHVREDEISLFGFREKADREVFLMLINVKGIGPKTANNILAKASANEIINAIALSDINFLKKLPGIGVKSAQQIILDLKNKLAVEVKEVINQDLEDALLGLKNLGYNSNDINYVKKQLSKKVMSTDEYLRNALSLINKRKGI